MTEPDDRRLVPVYCFGGQILVPTPAITDGGWDVHVGPVHVIQRGDLAALASVLQRVATSPPPTVSHAWNLARKVFEVVQVAGVSSWRKFSRAARFWSLSVEAGQVSASPTRLERGTFMFEGVDLELGPSNDWIAVAQKLLDLMDTPTEPD